MSAQSDMYAIANRRLSKTQSNGCLSGRTTNKENKSVWKVVSHKNFTNICYEEYRRYDKSNGHRHHLVWLVLSMPVHFNSPSSSSSSSHTQSHDFNFGSHPEVIVHQSSSIRFIHHVSINLWHFFVCFQFQFRIRLVNVQCEWPRCNSPWSDFGIGFGSIRCTSIASLHGRRSIDHPIRMVNCGLSVCGFLVSCARVFASNGMNASARVVDVQ